MEALSGFVGILALVWAVVGIVFFIMVLSVSIDAARLLRRANRIIDLLEAQNAILAKK